MRVPVAVATAGAPVTTVTDWDSKQEHGVQEMEAKLMVVLIGNEEAGSGGNGRGSGELGAWPWRPWRNAAREQGRELGGRKVREGGQERLRRST